MQERSNIACRHRGWSLSVQFRARGPAKHTFPATDWLRFEYSTTSVVLVPQCRFGPAPLGRCMVLLDISATGEENVIEYDKDKQMNDLDYLMLLSEAISTGKQ